MDVVEIEFTDALTAYNMSDETIDEIFERVKADSVENNEDLDQNHDYLRGLQTMIGLIYQSDMNSEQFIIVINDIFPN